MAKFKPVRITKDTINEYLEKGYWSKETFSDYLEKHTKEMPDREAVVDSKGRYTYSCLLYTSPSPRD